MKTTSSSARIELSPTDLNAQGGIYCPRPEAGMALWNGHPRVFLDVAKTGAAQCPYCGTNYQLKSTPTT